MQSTPDPLSDEALASHGAPELIRLLIRNEDRVPPNVIDECARRGDEMLDELGGLLQKDYYWGDDQTTGEWWLLLHAVMILGLMPQERAGELLVSYMRRMDEADDENLQEWLAGYWPAFFRNKPAGIIAALRALGEDRARGWFMRVSAIDAAIAKAEAIGPMSSDEVLAWAATMAFDDHEDYDVRTLVGNTLLDFARPEHRNALEALADLQPHIGRVFGRAEIAQQYAAGPDQHEWERSQDPWEFYTPQAIAERQARWAEEAAREEEEALADEQVETYVRAEPKIGRNDPCPCGSGKKYKKCCMP